MLFKKKDIREREILYDIPYIWSLKRNDMYHGFGREGRRKRVRCMERVTWKLTLPYVK